jgi:hypothetical protein
MNSLIINQNLIIELKEKRFTLLRLKEKVRISKLITPKETLTKIYQVICYHQSN